MSSSSSAAASAASSDPEAAASPGGTSAPPPPPAVGVRVLLEGLAHFVARPSLMVKVICPILISLISVALSLGLLLAFALEPQAELLESAGWPAWLAWVGAVSMVLAEVALSNLILMLVLTGNVQGEIFRRVLEEKGVLAELRILHGGDVPEQNCLRDVCHSINFLLLRLPLLIITLPLNAVPILGQIAWVLLNGWLYSWELTSEFMVMYKKAYRWGQQWRYVKSNFAVYATFGGCAMGLELIPFAGPWVFFASNACGAALLSKDIFDRRPNAPNGQKEAVV